MPAQNALEQLRSQLKTLRELSKNIARQTPFPERIADFFFKCSMPSMDTEHCSTITVESITDWIQSQLPINGATSVHLLKSQTEVGTMYCIFFSNDVSQLLGEQYPKKRIFADKEDPALSKLLEKSSFIIIKNLN